MRMSHLKLGAAVAALVTTAIVAGCVNVSSLDCNEIAERAKGISQQQPVKIESIANVREISRTDTDARCTGDATLADGAGTAPVFLRAYEENGNTIVAYQGTPFP